MERYETSFRSGSLALVVLLYGTNLSGSSSGFYYAALVVVAGIWVPMCRLANRLFVVDVFGVGENRSLDHGQSPSLSVSSKTKNLTGEKGTKNKTALS